MNNNTSHEPMPLACQHLVRLRMVTDELEERVAGLNTSEEFLIRRAQALVDSLAIRNEIQKQLQSSDLSI